MKLGVLGSGKGSNFRSIVDAIAEGRLRAEVCLVMADVPDAGILALARERGIAAEAIPGGRYRTRLETATEQAVADRLRRAGAEWVVLAGFMRLLKGPLLTAFPGRIINIHPSLLPLYPGLESWKQALAAGAAEAGCTVHYVDAGMDTGTIIAQRVVPVIAGDTPETLHARIQAAEHALYPEVLARLGATHS